MLANSPVLPAFRSVKKGKCYSFGFGRSSAMRQLMSLGGDNELSEPRAHHPGYDHGKFFGSKERNRLLRGKC